MRNYSGDCGDAAALDSLLSLAVRSLEDDFSRSAPNASDTASLLVQRALQWHACNGGRASGLRADTMRYPRPRPFNATAEAQAGRRELAPADSPARPLPDRAAPVPAAYDAPSHTNSRQAPLRGSLALAKGLPAPSHRPLDVPRLADPFAPRPGRPVASNSSGKVAREGRPRFSAQQRGRADLFDDNNMKIATESASSVEKGERGWDEHVVTGLCRALTVAICATYLRTCDDSRKTTLFEDGSRALVPISVLKTRAGGRETTADNLIAFVAMLLSAEPRQAARLLRSHGTSQREKAHAPRCIRRPSPPHNRRPSSRWPQGL